MATITLSQISNGDALDATVVDANFDTVASEVNGNLDEANLKNGAVTTAKIAANAVTAAKVSAEAWTDWAPAATGFSGTPTVTLARYFQVGKLVFCTLAVSGTSNATSTGFTLPASPKSTAKVTGAFATLDNGVAQTSPGGVSMTASSTAAVVIKNADGNVSWTNIGSKSFGGFFFYEAA